MAKVPRRVNLVAHTLLEHLGLREAAIRLALPYLHAVAGNPEHAAGAGLQTHLAEVVTEGAE